MKNRIFHPAIGVSRAGRALRKSRAHLLGSASRFLLLAGILAGIPTVCAYAQSEVVTVTAEKQSATTSIDRKTYRTASDLSATAGSVNDVLRNIPSVEVDIQGNVSLRGDTNVQILIDGKPSTMLSAANRADVLSQMPANSIDSIEVMTNPSAQYKPDGSSGIINIITKKTQKPGFSGTLQSNYGTEGRYNLGASAAYAAGGLSVTGNITFRHDIRKRTGTDVRTRIASSGNTASNQDLMNAQPRHAFVASLSAKYKFDPKNQINAGLSFNQRLVRPYTLEHNMATDTMGALISDNDRLGMGRGLEVSNQASAGYTYIFDDKGEFTIDLRRGQTHENRNTGYTSTFRTPVAAPALSELLLHSNIIQSEYTGEYVGNLWGGKIKAGYDLQQDHSVFNNYGGTIVGTTHTPDPAQTNLFIYGQSIHAGYATYQFVLGKDWHFLGGLRLEQTRVGTNQVTSGIVNKNSYFRAYPSLHVEYALDADQILSFSYSHRVSRPEADEVNPYPVFVDAFSVRAGNPLLLPQETHSLELGYETKLWGANLAATAFWRQTYNAATQVSRYISPTVLLNTLENLGESQSGGLDMTATGKLWSDFSYNLAATTFYNELNASNLGIGKIKAGLSYTLKGSLDYSLTPIDLIQVSGNYSGRRLTAQGYRAPAGLLNIGFRHKLRDDLALVTTLADVLNSQYSKTVTNIPTLSEVNDQHSMGRTFYIGLTWAFGGKPAKDQFDYSGGG